MIFKSIYIYYLDLNAFFENVNNGFFIQHTLESIINNPEGK